MIFSQQPIAVRRALRSEGTPQDADHGVTATLYVDGIANAAVVTVLKVATGVYLFSVTLPTLTVGQLIRIEAYFELDGLARVLEVFSDSCDSSSSIVEWSEPSGSGTYALTFAELCQALYDLLGRTASACETTMVKRMVNEAMAEIVATKRWRWQLTTTSVTITGGSYNTTAPTDCVNILNVQDASENPVEFVELETFNEVFRPDKTTTGAPQLYTVQHADTGGVPIFRVWPFQTTNATATIRYYRKVPQLVENADVPLMPTDFHFAIIKGAEARFRAWENNELAAQTRQEFDGILARLVTLDGGTEE